MEYSENQRESLPSQSIEACGERKNGVEDSVAATMEYNCMTGKADEGRAPLSEPAFGVYQLPVDTPVDNYEESFPNLGGERPYSEEAGGEGSHYDLYQSTDVSAAAGESRSHGETAPPITLSRLNGDEREGARPLNSDSYPGSNPRGSVQETGSQGDKALGSVSRGRVSADPNSQNKGAMAPRGRRRSSSVSTLNQQLALLHAGSSSEPCTQSCTSAGGGAVATPDEVRGFMRTLTEQHLRTIAVWEKRVSVAEVYRGKPTRTGGLPAQLRPADKGFLERSERGIADHLKQLYDARELLAHQETIYEDTRPVFEAHSTADRLAAEANEAWITECQHMSAQALGYISQSEALMRRVNRMLSEDDEGVDIYLPRRFSSAQRRGSSPCRLESHSGSVYGPSPSRPRSRSRRASVRRADGQFTLAVGFGDNSHSDCGSRRDSTSTHPDGALIIPNQSPAEEANGGAEAADNASHPIQRGRHQPIVTPGLDSPSQRSPHRRSCVRGNSRGRESSPLHPPQLHPDTALRGDREPGSPYDRRSPYGRLSPARGRLSPAPSNPPQQRVEGSQNETQKMITDGGSNTPNSRNSGDQNGLQEYRDPNGYQAELINYRSPRGPAEPYSPEPTLSEAQRRQLLLSIAYYEENAASLRKADLKTARGCFVELYGPQRGLRQYCNWVDDLALQALRQNR